MRTVMLIAALAGALGVGCGGEADAPLGGPYGGTGHSPGPTAGQSVNATDPPNVAGGGPSAPSDGGAAAPMVCSGVAESLDAGTSSSDAGAPTWSGVYKSYFASGTVGGCPLCHSSMSNASDAYAWLKAKGQIPAIADASQSTLTWFGGNMPPRGPCANVSAVADLRAWAAAGALDN